MVDDAVAAVDDDEANDDSYDGDDDPSFVLYSKSSLRRAKCWQIK